jgi:predicted nucleic acid-binding protein
MNNFPQHFAAKGWLDRCLNSSAPVGLQWLILLGFLRIVTNSRTFEQPESVKEAWKQIKEWQNPLS